MKDDLYEAVEEVFEHLGSGWSETIYHSALQRELSERGIAHHSEGTIPVMYKGAPVGRRRPDMFLVDEDGETVIVELKAGSSSGRAQLLEYLDIVADDHNYNQIVGGAVVRFNDELEFEYEDVSN